MLVSIALCTYNGELYLKELLDSVLSQSYAEFELVAIDDKSTDKTYTILQDYSSKDNRIRVYQNQKNIGFNKNFEKAFKLCSGTYIAICDQDDIWLENKLSTLIRNIDNALLIHSNSKIILDNGQETDEFLFSDTEEGYLYTKYENLLLGNRVTGHSCLIDRKLLEKALPIPGGAYYDWWLGFVAAYFHGIKYVGHVLTLYRRHENSVIFNEQLGRKHSRYKFLKTEFELVKRHLERFSEFEHLHKPDHNFVKELYITYKKKSKKLFALDLFLFTNKYFTLLFPELRKKNFKKWSFLFRFCRGIRLLKIHE